MTGIFVRSVGFRVAHDSNHAGHSAPERRHTWRMTPILRNVPALAEAPIPASSRASGVLAAQLVAGWGGIIRDAVPRNVKRPRLTGFAEAF
jgi:hypothetical protein